MESSFADMTVLIVVDDETLLESLKHMVRDFGVVSLLIARDGEDGLSQLREKPVDLVIGDYGLTPVNGLDIARRLRHGEGAADPAIPIIMLATDHERTLIEAAHDIGVNGLIDKPISPSSLYSRMLSVMTESRYIIQTENYIGPDRRKNPRGYIAVKESADGKHDDQVVDDRAKVKSSTAALPRPPESPFISSAHNDIETIIRALDAAARDPSRRPQAMRSIGSLAALIMEQGNKANYPLISSIAESLHNACRRAPMPDMDQLEVVRSHITAMAALIADEIDGHGRAMDAAILDLLCGSARQQNIHPQPVIWPRASA